MGGVSKSMRQWDWLRISAVVGGLVTIGLVTIALVTPAWVSSGPFPVTVSNITLAPPTTGSDQPSTLIFNLTYSPNLAKAGALRYQWGPMLYCVKVYLIMYSCLCILRASYR